MAHERTEVLCRVENVIKFQLQVFANAEDTILAYADSKLIVMQASR